MAADPNLIKGAAMMYQNQMVGAASEGLQKGFEQSIQPLVNKLEEQENKAKLSDEELKSWLNKLNSNVDGNGFSGPEQKVAKEWALKKRNEYADLAKQLSKMSASDPNYLDVKSKLDDITQSFENFRKNRDALAAGKTEFKKLAEKNKFSAANDSFNPYNKDFYKIGDDGMIIFNSSKGDIKLGETTFPSLVNEDAMKDFRINAAKVSDLLSKGHSLKTVKDRVIPSLKETLNSGNVFDSIVYDELMPELNTNEEAQKKIQAYKNATGDAKKALKNEITDIIIELGIGAPISEGREARQIFLRERSRSRNNGSKTNVSNVEKFKKKLEANQKATNSILSSLKLDGKNQQKLIRIPIVRDNRYTDEFASVPVRISADPTMVDNEAVYDQSTIRYEIKVGGSWNTLSIEEIARYNIEESMLNKSEADKELIGSPIVPFQKGRLDGI